MNFEQKYNKLVDAIKVLQEANPSDEGIQNWVHDNVPELVESEDEGIRKTLIELVRCNERSGYFSFNNIETSSIIAWLEKQGEQKSSLPKWRYKRDDTPLLSDSLVLNKYGCVLKAPAGASISDAWVLDYAELAKLPKEEPEKQEENKPADKTGPTFQNGQWIVWQNKYYKVNDNGCGYELIDQNGLRTSIEYGTIDKSAHLWSIADAKDGDILMTAASRNCPFIYRKTNYNNNLAYYYAGINGNGDFCEGCLKRRLYHFGPVANITPATKEQCDLLFRKMKEAGYKWDAKNKCLCTIN